MPASAPTIYPCLSYRDPRTAIEWLERAFGFERMLVYPEGDEPLVHAEIAFGGGVVMIGTLPEEHFDTPKRPFNAPYVYVADPDSHHARAVAAGAEVTRELGDTDYGARQYCARDPEGNEWSFGTYRPAPAASGSSAGAAASGGGG